MAISLRLSEPDMELIKAYAKLHGITVSEFARRSMLEKIEDEFDLEAIREYENDKNNNTLKTYSHDKAWRLIEG